MKKHKNLNFRQDIDMDLFFGASREDAKYFIPYGYPDENLGFYIFSIVFAKIL